MNKKTAHISIDDVTFALQRLSDYNYSNIYEEKLFCYLRLLHHLFGAKISLYVYANYGEWNIDKVSNHFKSELAEAKDWLRFGFHAASEDQKDDNILPKFADAYEMTTNSISNFAGADSIASILRLHYWFYPNEYLEILKKNRTHTILVKNGQTVDTSLSLWKTDIRIESDSISSICGKIMHYDQAQPIVVFTHEWALSRKIRFKMIMVILMIRLMGYTFICD